MNEPSAYDKLMDHEYDGIREFDNPLPGWWTWLFVGSVFFSIVYVGYFHIGVGPSIEDRYQAASARQTEALLAQLGDIAPDSETIVRFMHNDEWMTSMQSVFVGNCAQCHAGDGGGNIGPNLADDFYKNVKEPADIFNVISNGVAGTSMAPWNARLSEPQIILLAAYAASLRGTTPANPKAQEGIRIDPWPAPAPASEDTAEEAPPEDSA